jgi:hypothetical protein
MGLLFSLQSPRIKAGQECPIGAEGFDAAGPSLTLQGVQPIPSLRTKAFRSGRDFKVY